MIHEVTVKVIRKSNQPRSVMSLNHFPGLITFQEVFGRCFPWSVEVIRESDPQSNQPRSVMSLNHFPGLITFQEVFGRCFPWSGEVIREFLKLYFFYFLIFETKSKTFPKNIIFLKKKKVFIDRLFLFYYQLNSWILQLTVKVIHKSDPRSNRKSDP